MGKIIGIDFGTTRTVAAIMEAGKPVCIPERRGNRYIPSVALAGPDGEFAIGWEAVTHPRRHESEHITINSIKRSVGRQDETGWGWWKTRPHEVAALILGRLKLDVDAYVGEAITRAVVAIPAYFDFNQRAAVRDAARIAGFDVLRLINEATAAGLAYHVGKGRNETIAVYDFGGGTFDVSILDVGEGVVEVKSTNGEALLGGDDLDQRIVDWLVGEFRTREGIDVSKSRVAMQRLKEAAEKAKIDLSTMMETEINVPFLASDPSGAQHMALKLTRAKLESLIGDLLAKTVAPCRQALADAGITSKNIDQVVLIGGSTRIPRVQDLVRELFEREPHKGVNRDEGVAVGAAVMAGVLSGENKNILLLDISPLSLGVETRDGGVTVVIPRNTTIPTRKAAQFSTTIDDQAEVTVRVLQGDHPKATDNVLVGELQLVGIPLARVGIPQIEVTFDIDANSCISASAKDCGTGREVRTVMASPYRLSEAQMKVMSTKVAAVLSTISARQREQEAASDREQEQLANQRLTRQADHVIQWIDEMLSNPALQQSYGEDAGIAAGGRTVLSDFVERGASTPDLALMIQHVQLEISRSAGRALARIASALVRDPYFIAWANSAARLAHEDGPRSSPDDELQAIVDPIVRYHLAVPSNLAGSVASADRLREAMLAGAQNAAEGSSAAKCCVGVLFAYLGKEAFTDVGPWLPLQWQSPVPRSLGLLLIYRALSNRRSTHPQRLAVEVVGALENVLLDSEPAVQRFLLRLIDGSRESYFESAAPALVRFVKSSAEDSLRRLAIAMLAKPSFTRALAVSLELSISHEPFVRDVARDQLLETFRRQSASGDVWRELLGYPPDVLRDWLRAVPALQKERVKLVTEALSREKTVDQGLILRALALPPVYHGNGAGPFLDFLEGVADSDVRVAAISILADLPDVRAIAPLLMLTRDSDTAVRVRATEALATYRVAFDSETDRLITLAIASGRPRRMGDRFFLWQMGRKYPEVRRALAALHAGNNSVGRG